MAWRGDHARNASFSRLSSPTTGTPTRGRAWSARTSRVEPGPPLRPEGSSRLWRRRRSIAPRLKKKLQNRFDAGAPERLPGLQDRVSLMCRDAGGARMPLCSYPIRCCCPFFIFNLIVSQLEEQFEIVPALLFSSNRSAYSWRRLCSVIGNTSIETRGSNYEHSLLQVTTSTAFSCYQ